MIGCAPSTRLQPQCPAIPGELTKPLNELRQADDPLDIPEIYLHNMQACGICYVRYRGLVEAVESREE